MSHFILQSVKVVKLTDGEKEIYALGYAGKDNNVTYYGSQRTSVEFFQTVMTDKALSAISSLTIDVLCGGTQLKDKYNEELTVQAEFFAKRITTSFKNAKTVKVNKIDENGIDWGQGAAEIRMLFPKISVHISANMKYHHGVSEFNMNHGEFVKFMLDKDKTKDKVIQILKENKYLSAYLPIQYDLVNRYGAIVQKAKPEDKLTLNDVRTVAKYAGDWNTTVTKTDHRLTDINEIFSLLSNDEDPAKRFTIIYNMIDHDLLNNEEFARKVGSLGVSMRFFGDNIKSNPDIVQIFCDAKTSNLEYAADDIRSNKEFMLPYIAEHSSAMRYAGENLKDDIEVAFLAIKKSGSAIEHLSQRLKDSPEVCLASAEKYSYAHQYFSPRLKEYCDKDDPKPGLRNLILESEIKNSNHSAERKLKI